MSPRSRGRPPGRGRPHRATRRAPTGTPFDSHYPLDVESPAGLELGDDHWFDEPIFDERHSWVMPAGHGTYLGLDLELLDPVNEDQLTLLIEAQHPEMADALAAGDDVVGDNDEPINPRVHVAMHVIVANQLLADEPVESWQTVQRLSRQGYDWHNIMHMIAALVSEDIYTAMTRRELFDAADYARRLEALPDDWPPPNGP